MSGRPEGCVSSPERTAAVLAVSPSPAERVRLRKILSQENWRLYEASDCCEALPLLRDQSVPVLLCKHDHVDGNWEDLLNTTASLPAPPNLVVFTRLADESLWAKVLNVSGLRRADNAFRAGGDLASYLRCLEPLAMRLWREHRQ